MRQLSLQEISSVSGAEKALSQMTPTDFIPYVAGYFGAMFLGSKASSWTHAFISDKVTSEMFSQALSTAAGTVGYVVGGVSSYFAADQANKRVVQKLV